MRAVVSEKELNKILNKCEYDIDNKKWDIPLFVIKERAVQLPKVPINIKDNKSKNEFKNQ